MSFTPRFLSSVSTPSQNLAPSLPLVHNPSTSLRPSKSIPIATYTAIFDPPLVPHLHVKRIQVTASVTSEIKRRTDFHAVDLLQVPLDLPRRHSARIQRQNLVIEAVKARLVLA
jgi:hypothetical protein